MAAAPAVGGACFTASELQDSLSEVYECSFHATLPRHGAVNLAGLIVRGVRAQEEHDGGGNVVELTCISLTVLGRVVTMTTAPTPEVASFYRLALKVLFEDMDAMSLLGSVSLTWQQTCEQAFLSSPAGPKLDTCLWSLNFVLKRLLKDNSGELVRAVLTAFDASVSTLASRLLPVGAASDVDTLCQLLELLELLTASSEGRAYAGCQMLVHTHAAALMAAVSCSPRYFLSKHAALLLKRAALHKAGEDWLAGGGPAREHAGSDVASLARAVLNGVAGGWLPSVRVESASFFGGTSGKRREGGDGVMLRAVGLLVIKCVEHHVRSAAAGAEACGYLQALWSFLGQTEVVHTCRLMTRVFGEQDDDMMEAAKALLAIFLQLREDPSLDFGVGDAACTCGCNPHCHFLSLLQSVAFDHRVLLDFLISMETCFLEYLVRYLKYLRTDWQGFTAACQRVGVSPESDSGQVSTSSGRSLVDYDTSDESETDNAEGTAEGLDCGNTAAGGTLARAVGCLTKLRLLVDRLQTKKMFPYNAESLLKLLAHVDACEGQNRKDSNIQNSSSSQPILQDRVAGGAGAYLSYNRAEGSVHPGGTPWTSRHLITGPTQIDRQHSHTRDHLVLPINLSPGACLWKWEEAGVPTQSRGEHANSTQKAPQPGIEPRTAGPSYCEADALTPLPP
ncbi:protein Lines homolog 1 isoform X2 [Nerophis ophidion]|uniref:protein Lines homolog 1 isoform X2 n=1 Tax=Nerophis ophidion TaxID=159077 RepID=UPI002AE097D1|nr:protein Lines homolog 1 isoform X2 [Nerophis ophidion]